LVHIKEVGRNLSGIHAFRLPFAGQVEAASCINCHLLENMVLGTPVQIVGRREWESGNSREALCRRHMVKLHQAAGVRKWERSKQDGIHHLKNCGVSSDSQGEYNYGGGCESGTLAEHPESVFEVVKQSSHCRPPFE